MPLIDAMFASGVVHMGPATNDPERQVATFDPVAIAELLAARDRELQTFLWILGEWEFENHVPAGLRNPAYVDIGRISYVRGDDRAWISIALPNGKTVPLLTFDAWSQQWIYVLTNGAFGILRSTGWKDDHIVFAGTMTMVGVTCEWRMTWSRRGPELFTFVNEEKLPDGRWAYIDEWRYVRRSA
jgi:hypothetical protein